MSLNKYDENSIQILEGLSAVRKRPGMYIGSTDTRGLHHLVFEIVDNAIDEALAGSAKEIVVTIKSDNSIQVDDNGRGMPYKIHSSGRPTTEVIFTMLHAGGKFSDELGYKTSGGLHGVGAAVVNALSQFLEVTIYRDNKIFNQRFTNGGAEISPLLEIGETKKTGTSIWFKPDPKIFTTTLFQYEILKERLRESAFLISGLKIVLNDQRKNLKEEFKFEEGIKEYINFIDKDKERITKIEDIFGKYQTNNQSTIEVDIAFGYTNSYLETIVSFVNNVKTKDGGTHEIGFKSGFTRSINEYARKYQLLKEKDSNLDGVDIREGISAIISLKIPESILEFEGQVKGKLGTPEAKSAVESITYEKLATYLEENKDDACTIIKRAINASKVREAARKARDEARNGKTKGKKEISLSGKLTPAQSKDKNLNELFLVEGVSAGGSAKQGRNRHFQAILPLRGKVINTEKSNLDTALNNEEINAIIHTIGAGFGSDFDLEKCLYKKIIIMTDADTDGAHIQILLLTFFFRYMKPLIENGYLYLALPPLYKVTSLKKGKPDTLYAWTEEELNQCLKEQNKNKQIQRFKGLGEMNADQLWETTMDPKTRTLIRVNICELSELDKKISILMGDDVLPRRLWIEDNVDFELSDDFKIESERNE